MINSHIHIIAFDVPYPANYGGVIDIYYRMTALKQLGYKLTLHCFEYGRGEQEELQSLCEKVYYYKRKKLLIDAISRKPFIVRSRNHPELLSNLLKDQAPILFEGLHTTNFLKDERLKSRLKIVRTHNIEHVYYDALADKSKGRKRIYFRSEARKLKRYEQVLDHADAILAIQEDDKEHFKQYCANTMVLPASIPTKRNSGYQNTKPYALFHGNLSVPENDDAAMWLVEHIFTNPEINYVVAGRGPSPELVSLCSKRGVEIHQSPSEQKMQSIISDARIHVLITHQATGLKLKLLEAVNSSGHVVVNELMVKSTTLENLCVVRNTIADMNQSLEALIDKPLSQDEYDSRQNYLTEHFDTLKNCKSVFGQLLNH